MDIHFTPEQDELIRRVVARGRLSRPEDVLHEAVDVLMKREYIRDEIMLLLNLIDRTPHDEASVLATMKGHLLSALALTDGQSGDDPFAAFDEWGGEVDRKAYAGL